MQVNNKRVKKYNRFIITSAYLLVIMIWSTTPLTIKWSSEGVDYLFGIVLRMVIGATLATLITLIFYKKISFTKTSCKAYVSVALAMFGGMIPVYWGAQYISSGLISVVFGLTPMTTGYLAWRILNEQSFTGIKIIGVTSGLIGLLIVFYENIFLGENHLYGLSAIIIAVIVHSLSSVWVKGLKVDIPAISLVSGGLLFSMPLFVTVYLLFAPELPEIIPSKALWSTLYLGVVGSVLGFVSYYFLLKQLPASQVAMITLVTPVLSLWIGGTLNGEVISISIYLGTVFVLTGLALHQWGDVLSNKVWQRLKVYYG